MNVRHPITGCAYQSLTGFWAVEPHAFALLVEQARAYDLRDLARLNAEAEAREREEAAKLPADQPPAKPYDLHGTTAVIHVTGPTTPQPTSFSRLLGGTATSHVERSLRAAVADDQAKSILMRYESPGGTLAGSAELVDRLRWAAQHKPLLSHIDNMGCSAAMLYSAQGRRVTANRTANVGSIGVMSKPLVDSSGAAAARGLRVYPIASGKWKTLGMDGVPVTAEQIGEMQRQVDAAADDFIADVAAARRLTPKFIRSLEAAVFTAKEGRERNLIDDVCSFEQALASAA
jgi:signal peptide peptidase SppA